VRSAATIATKEAGGLDTDRKNIAHIVASAVMNKTKEMSPGMLGIEDGNDDDDDNDYECEYEKVMNDEQNDANKDEDEDESSKKDKVHVNNDESDTGDRVININDSNDDFMNASSSYASSSVSDEYFDSTHSLNENNIDDQEIHGNDSNNDVMNTRDLSVSSYASDEYLYSSHSLNENPRCDKDEVSVTIERISHSPVNDNTLTSSHNLLSLSDQDRDVETFKNCKMITCYGDDTKLATPDQKDKTDLEQHEYEDEIPFFRHDKTSNEYRETNEYQFRKSHACNKIVQKPCKKTSRTCHECIFVKRFPNFFCIFVSYYRQHSSTREKESKRGILSDFSNRQFVDRLEQLETSLKPFLLLDNVKMSGMDRYFHVQSPSKPEVASIVFDSLEDRTDWEEALTLSFNWNLLWTWSRTKIDHFPTLIFQKYNHFEASRFLTRKDCLKRNIERARNARFRTGRTSSQESASELDFHIMTETFVLPKEYVSFTKSFLTCQKTDRMTNFWIIKPVGLSRGRGIKIVNDICAVSYSEPVVVQKYLSKPYLFDGYKFDLRLYILVTSFSPLEAFIYRQGFARFATKPYSSSAIDIENEQIHLTNSSIQIKYNLNLDHPVKRAKYMGGGNKVSLEWLWTSLASKGVNIKSLQSKIDEVCVKSLICSQHHIPNQVSM